MAQTPKFASLSETKSSASDKEAPITPTAQSRAVLAGNVFVVTTALSAASTAEQEEPVVGQKRPLSDCTTTTTPALDDDLRLALQRARDRRANLVASLRAKRTPPFPNTVPVNVYHARVQRDRDARTTTVVESVLQNSDHWTLDHYRAVTGHPAFPFIARFGATLNIYVYGPGSKVLVHIDPESPNLRQDDLRAYNDTLALK